MNFTRLYDKETINKARGVFDLTQGGCDYNTFLAYKWLFPDLEMKSDVPRSGKVLPGQVVGLMRGVVRDLENLALRNGAVSAGQILTTALGAMAIGGEERVIVLLEDMSRMGLTTWDHSISVAFNAVNVGFGYAPLAENKHVRENYFEFLVHLGLSGLLHDVGKLKLKDVVELPGRLNAEQFDRIKTHAGRGLQYINGTEGASDWLPEECWLAAARHHDSYDEKAFAELDGGTRAYSLKLDSERGEYDDIIVDIVSVADQFTALSEKRSYKTARDVVECVSMVVGNLFSTSLDRTRKTRRLDMLGKMLKNTNLSLKEFPPEKILSLSDALIRKSDEMFLKMGNKDEGDVMNEFLTEAKFREITFFGDKSVELVDKLLEEWKEKKEAEKNLRLLSEETGIPEEELRLAEEMNSDKSATFRERLNAEPEGERKRYAEMEIVKIINSIDYEMAKLPVKNENEMTAEEKAVEKRYVSIKQKLAETLMEGLVIRNVLPAEQKEEQIDGAVEQREYGVVEEKVSGQTVENGETKVVEKAKRAFGGAFGNSFSSGLKNAENAEKEKVENVEIENVIILESDSSKSEESVKRGKRIVREKKKPRPSVAKVAEQSSEAKTATQSERKTNTFTRRGSAGNKVTE